MIKPGHSKYSALVYYKAIIVNFDWYCNCKHDGEIVGKQNCRLRPKSQWNYLHNVNHWFQDWRAVITKCVGLQLLWYRNLGLLMTHGSKCMQFLSIVLPTVQSPKLWSNLCVRTLSFEIKGACVFFKHFFTKRSFNRYFFLIINSMFEWNDF